MSKTLKEIVSNLRGQADTAYPYDVDTMNTLEAIADEVEEAASRAYTEIDRVVCSVDDMSSTDIDAVRRAMDATIGDFYG